MEEYQLKDLLLPSFGGRIGIEICIAISDCVNLFKDKEGSHRFVLHNKGEVLSALQVMTKPPHNQIGLVCNVYTHPDHRRRGYALHLLKKAKLYFEILDYSEDLSEAGAAWLKAAKNLVS